MVVKIMVMIIIQTSRERQFKFTAWGLMPVSISSVCFVNVFQATQMYHYYAVKYISESLFVSVTCWRTCQNMQRSISNGHRNLEIHIADQTYTHMHTPPEPLEGRYSTPQARAHILTDAVSPSPCHAHYLECVCVCELNRHVSLD